MPVHRLYTEMQVISFVPLQPLRKFFAEAHLIVGIGWPTTVVIGHKAVSIDDQKCWRLKGAAILKTRASVHQAAELDSLIRNPMFPKRFLCVFARMASR